MSFWLSNSIPRLFLPAFFCLLGGFLSCFSGGITVVFPMLAPMVASIAAASSLNPVFLFCSVVFGAGFTAVSPFSTGGAIFLANCRDEEMAKKLVVGDLGMAAYGMVASMVLVTIINVIF